MNGYIAADLLTQDAGRLESVTSDHSLHGAKIWITSDGRVGYDAATLDQPDRIKPVERAIEYRSDLTIDLEPYTVAVVEIAAR